MEETSEGPESEVGRRTFVKTAAAAAAAGIGFVAGAEITQHHLTTKSEAERKKLINQCVGELNTLRAQLKLEQEKDKAKQLKKSPEGKEAQAEILKKLLNRIRELEAEVRRLGREWRAIPPSPKRRDI